MRRILSCGRFPVDWTISAEPTAVDWNLSCIRAPRLERVPWSNEVLANGRMRLFQNADKSQRGMRIQSVGPSHSEATMRVYKNLRFIFLFGLLSERASVGSSVTRRASRRAMEALLLRSPGGLAGALQAPMNFGSRACHARRT